jgi:hypothetical protein
MSKLICSTSVQSIGCTFLDWSIQYLSGHNKMLNKNLGWVDVLTNPLNDNNAHGHRKNHPDGLDKAQSCAKYLLENADFSTMYPHPLYVKTAADNLGKDLQNLNQLEWQQIKEHCHKDYNQMLSSLSSQGAKIIFVRMNKNMPLYLLPNLRAVGSMKQNGHTPTSVDDIRNITDMLYFKDSVDTWTKLNLTDVWDVRERTALNIKPFECVDDSIDPGIEHYCMDSSDWWLNGHEKILEVMSWAEILVQQDRFDHWLSVYNQWKSIQLKLLDFQFNYQHIIECILTNKECFINLTFDQEVVIQHCLMYQHNLNLKTWQLSKFPNNTQDLHRLLEPNIHPVTPY